MAKRVYFLFNDVNKGKCIDGSYHDCYQKRKEKKFDPRKSSSLIKIYSIQ